MITLHLFGNVTIGFSRSLFERELVIKTAHLDMSISKFFLNRIFLKQRIRQDDSAQRRRTHKVGEGTRRTSMS